MNVRSIKSSSRAGALLASVLMLAASTVACGDDDNSAAGGRVDVAMITSGSHTDASFVQSWWKGSQGAAERLGERADVKFTDGLNSLDALDRSAAAALSTGSEFLFLSTSEAPQVVTKYAQEFPDAFVCGVEGPRESYPDNLCTMFPRFHEGAFLAGALAGLTTRTDRVGVVAAFDIPIQNLQTEGFALGARYVNPDVRVERSYTESLIDAGSGRAAAEAHYARGVDIILSALDEGSQGIYTAAKASGNYVIPQYADQYEDAPEVVLTSVLYRLDEISERMITTAVEGELAGQSYEFGLRELGVGELAEFRGEPGKRVSAETRKRLEEIQTMIEGGDLVLPGVAELATKDSGDRIDVSSLEGAGG